MRLIDADAYKKHLASFVVGGEKAIVKNGIGNYWIDGIHTAYREIDNVPTIKTFTLADIEEQYRKGLEKGLEERQHGEWAEYNVSTFRGTDGWGEPKWGKGKKFICKRCLRQTVIRENFCPNCGASMQANGRQVTGKLKEGEANESCN